MSHTFYSVTNLKHVQKEAFSNQTARTAQHFKTIFLPSCPPTPTHTHTHTFQPRSLQILVLPCKRLCSKKPSFTWLHKRGHMTLSCLIFGWGQIYYSLPSFGLKLPVFKGRGQGVSLSERDVLCHVCQNASLLHGNKTTLQKNPFFLKSLSLKCTVALHSHHLEMKGEIGLFSSKHGFDLSDNLPGMLVHLTPLAMPPFSVAWLNFR